MATTEQALQRAEWMAQHADIGSGAQVAAQQMVNNSQSGNQAAVVAQAAQENAREAASNEAFGGDATPLITEMQKQQQYLKSVGYTDDQINKITTDTFYTQYQGAVNNIQSENSFFGKLVNLTLGVGLAIATNGLSNAILLEVPTLSAAAANAMAATIIQLAQGQDVQTALRNGVASYAGSSVGQEVLDGFGKITDPTIKGMLANSLSYGTQAAIKGQDITQAMIAGAEGSAITQGVMSAGGNPDMTAQQKEDLLITAKAIGTFAAARKQGYSTEAALGAATAGLTTAKAQELQRTIPEQVSSMPVEQVNALSQIYAANANNNLSANANLPTGTQLATEAQIYDASSGARYDPNLNAYIIPKDESTQQAFGQDRSGNMSYAGSGAASDVIQAPSPVEGQYSYTEKSNTPGVLDTVYVVANTYNNLLDPITVYGNQDYEVTKQEGSQKFPLQQSSNDVLLGYINQTPGLPGIKNFSSTPKISQQASSQALQSGSPDIYSPYLESKEGGKRKNVWNQASLKTTDETGSAA
jgi:hypothetical protein